MREKPILEILSTNLRRAMAASTKYDTQVKLAKKSGVDQKTISRTLLMTNHPGVDKVQKLAQVFGLQSCELLSPDLVPPPEMSLRATYLARQYDAIKSPAEQEKAWSIVNLVLHGTTPQLAAVAEAAPVEEVQALPPASPPPASATPAPAGRVRVAAAPASKTTRARAR